MGGPTRSHARALLQGLTSWTCCARAILKVLLKNSSELADGTISRHASKKGSSSLVRRRSMEVNGKRLLQSHSTVVKFMVHAGRCLHGAAAYRPA